MAREKESLPQRIDRIGEEYAAARDAGDADRALRLRNELFSLLYTYIFEETRRTGVEDRTLAEQQYHADAERSKVTPEGLNTLAASNELRYFDPARGSAFKFCMTRAVKRSEDARYKDEGRNRYRDENGKLVRRPRADSLDRPLNADGEEEYTLGDVLADESGAHDAVALTETEDMALRYVELCVRFEELLEGRQRNPQRIGYFRLFFTDSSVTAIKRSLEQAVFRSREQELFRAMKLPFLDYFMSRTCRDVAAVCAAPLRLHGELVAGQSMEETKLPLPEDVYLSYLNKVERYPVKGVSAISNQRKEYEKFLALWLETRRD